MGPKPSSTRDSSTLATLLSRVALGDQRAFHTLYEQTAAHLLGVVLRIQHDRALAEDVLQEVYVNVWRASQSFNPALSQPMTWLGSIARNRAIDSLRRRKTEPITVSRYQSGPDNEETDMLANMPSDAPGPLDLLEQAVQAHGLGQCMQSLNGDQQRSLAMAYYEGLSHAEVAASLGQPLGTVKSWVRRGLQALKTCLERASLALG
jgi:RNA polymerase sigma factor (sigma-70 family)